MEGESAQIINANTETGTRKEVAEFPRVQSQEDNPSSRADYKEKTLPKNMQGGDNDSKGAAQGNEGPYGELNMEAAILADDVLRAGGYGARDGINSVLPVASDSTDFEASLLDARGYEDPQKEIQRPGLGYTKSRIKRQTIIKAFGVSLTRSLLLLLRINGDGLNPYNIIIISEDRDSSCGQKEDPYGHPGSIEKKGQINMQDGVNASKGATQGSEGPYGEFNMEPAVSADENLHAVDLGLEMV